MNATALIEKDPLHPMDTFPPSSRPSHVPIEDLDQVFAALYTDHCTRGELLMKLSGRGTTTFKLAAATYDDSHPVFRSGHIITLDEDLYDSILELCTMSSPHPPLTSTLQYSKPTTDPSDRPMPFYLRWLLAAAIKLTDKYS